jgi:hypothetical protein
VVNIPDVFTTETQSSEYCFIENFFLCVLSASAVNIPDSLIDFNHLNDL